MNSFANMKKSLKNLIFKLFLIEELKTFLFLNNFLLLNKIQLESNFTKSYFCGSNTNDVRTSKHSEYDYARKCQTLLWKCRTSAGNTGNMLGQKLI